MSDIILQCPTCKKPTKWDSKNPFRPFCCERCKLIDLGAWANEDHVIEGSELENLNPEDEAPDDF